MMTVIILETRTLGWVGSWRRCVPLAKWGVDGDPGQPAASFLFRGKKPGKNWAGTHWGLLQAGAGLALPRIRVLLF